MQFRGVGGKIQCLVAIYDPESKRTRQRMVYSYDRYLPVPAPIPGDMSFGDDDQRAAWAQEIGDHISAERARAEAERLGALPRRFGRAVNDVLAAMSEGSVDGDQVEEIRAHVQRLTAELRKRRRPAAKR
jgi:hypothetical protein